MTSGWFPLGRLLCSVY